MYQNTEFCNSTCTSTRRAIHVHCCTLKQALTRNSDLSQQLTINQLILAQKVNQKVD